MEVEPWHDGLASHVIKTSKVWLESVRLRQFTQYHEHLYSRGEWMIYIDDTAQLWIFALDRVSS